MTTTTATAVDHGITIGTEPVGAGRSYRAWCLCGFASELIADRGRAAAVGRIHLEDNPPEAASRS